ncbi:YbhB/YbcL family Raf kinase inhibitor-like protein [Nonomuraea sp. MCN248]|uniref:YbhB/YbcL family Raf kinase inhibitor-like protein n=1 Tax=Nonomuraea corallina TaxID=2989783 RepID=A0ABT4SD55_9ACTN|nr:YbhB/YbcL family Raf kinase inhibitor-like protein [Nonomuraea corallina]MDA0634968.1 YbhB/YbcL family Raf kinase inhibitor-like protein [Nonomuraea corallina]
MRRAAVLVTAVASALVVSGCGAIIGTSEAEEIARINVSSPDLREGRPLPRQFSCKGDQGSPPLRWSSRPLEEAETVAIVADSNSAESSGVYWVLYNIPASMTELGPNASESPPEGSGQAKVTSGKAGYDPPCAPEGAYRFSVYTLKGEVEAQEDAALSEVLRRIADLTIARGRLTAVNIE